jgi:hypothetical protein
VALAGGGQMRVRMALMLVACLHVRIYMVRSAVLNSPSTVVSVIPNSFSLTFTTVQCTVVIRLVLQNSTYKLFEPCWHTLNLYPVVWTSLDPLYL